MQQKYPSLTPIIQKDAKTVTVMVIIIGVSVQNLQLVHLALQMNPMAMILIPI
jgi:hypothetical protein